MIFTLEDTAKIYKDKQHEHQLRYKMLRARHFNNKGQNYNDLLREMIVRGNSI